MHSNVEVQRELMSSQQLLDNLLLTQITTVGNTGLQKEETFLKNLINDLSSKVNFTFLTTFCIYYITIELISASE